MSKKLSVWLYLLLSAVSLMLFVLTVVASSGENGVWKSTLLPLSLSFLALSLIVATVAYSPKKSIYSIGFYLTHVGIVFFLAGCLAYSLFGHSVNVAPPVVSSLTESISSAIVSGGDEVPSGYYNRIPGKNGDVAELGFNFRVTDFTAEYYDEEKNSPKHYEALLDILDGESSIQKSLTVNSPVYCNGWKIYLMSVSVNPVYGYDEVHLLFKRDPGEIMSNTGIILTCIGVFAMSFLRPAFIRKEDEK